MNKISKGDKVICVKNYYNIKKGDILTVKSIKKLNRRKYLCFEEKIIGFFNFENFDYYKPIEGNYEKWDE